MSLEQLRDSLPDYARDLKLNLGSVLTVQGAPGLSARQIWGTALASAIASRHLPLVAAIEAAARVELDDVGIQGAKAAAAIRTMLGCKVPSFGIWPCGARGGTEKKASLNGSSSRFFRSNLVS